MSAVLHFLAVNQQTLSLQFYLDADVQTVRAAVASALQIPIDSFWLLSNQRRMDFGIVADYRVNGEFSHIIHVILRQDRTIEVHLLDGRVFSFNQAVDDSTMLMGSLKSQLATVVDIPSAHQRLIFDGRAMDDSEPCTTVAPFQNPLVLYLVRNTQALGLLPSSEEVPSPRNETFLMRSRSPSPSLLFFETDEFSPSFEGSSLRLFQDSSDPKDAAPVTQHAASNIAPLTFANMAVHATSSRSSKKSATVTPHSCSSVQSLLRDDDWTKIDDPVKRRQARNRLAAERSRLKKLSRVQELEELLEQTTEEKELAIAKAEKLEQENRELWAAHRTLQEQFLSIQTQLMGMSLEQPPSKPAFKSDTPYTGCQPFPKFKDFNGLIPGH
jgi:hypothetical protein